MDWTVDYGDGPRPCTVPHCWKQDVDVRWEGPAVYQTQILVESPGSSLLFHGVSYRARVFLNDVFVLEHRGIWDSFSVPLGEAVGLVELRVEVVKNGGATFSVQDVLSGFLPYVFHTFGGIYREVELLHPPLASGGEEVGVEGPPAPRISVEGTKLFIDGKPWYMRGVLSWGWYPEVGSPHPPIEIIRDEVRKVKALGFNLIKFCLWLPPHSYFQVLEEEDMWAWVELPLWLPSEKLDLEEAFAECQRIVRQYRHHDRIVTWTCGCELSTSTPQEFRKRLFDMVTGLTGCPLVKDNSGGSEMYGGDLREYGTFYDFHPYCDTMFYPPVLESLQIGPRKKLPILLGEFNDYDAYRPIGPLGGEEFLESHEEFPWVNKSYRSDRPYWASSDPRLNDQGVRWQHDVPGVLDDSSIRTESQTESELVETSHAKCGWIREFVTKSVLAQSDISGYVVTGLADTPISTSGVSNERALAGIFDDVTFFLIPYRRPPWVRGGNRPGWSDTSNFFAGQNTLCLGARSTKGFQGQIELRWNEAPHDFQTFELNLKPDEPTKIADLTRILRAGTDGFWVSLSGNSQNVSYFSLSIFEPIDWSKNNGWVVGASASQLLGLAEVSRSRSAHVVAKDETVEGVCILETVGTQEKPFWRECVTSNSSGLDFFDSWDCLLPVSSDRVMNPVWLETHLPDAEWLLTRVDSRTYEQHPYIARKGGIIVTSLRPWGGLGAQPPDFASNPAGHELLRLLIRLSEI